MTLISIDKVVATVAKVFVSVMAVAKVSIITGIRLCASEKDQPKANLQWAKVSWRRRSSKGISHRSGHNIYDFSGIWTGLVWILLSPRLNGSVAKNLLDHE